MTDVGKDNWARELVVNFPELIAPGTPVDVRPGWMPIVDAACRVHAALAGVTIPRIASRNGSLQLHSVDSGEWGDLTLGIGGGAAVLAVEGVDVTEAAEWFRARAAPELPPLYSDAAAFDETWIRMIYEEIGVWLAFTLRNLPPVLNQLPEELRLNVQFSAKERGLRPHRAADDATLLAMAVRELHSFPEWRDRLQNKLW